MATRQIVIVGGGVIGSSIAWHLRASGRDVDVTVIERDPAYRRASSFLAMGGVRQQFSSAANIRLAQRSIGFYRRFDETMGAPGARPRAWLRQRGYLFLVNDAMVERFERRYATQRSLGAKVERLSVEAIRAHAPDLRLDDIRFGLFGPDDGYANPREVLAGFRRAAEAAGATYVTGSVTGVAVAGGRVRDVTLDDVNAVPADALVNAAGPFAARLAAMAGVDLPVAPVRQHLFRCALPHRWPYRFPVVIDPTGVHWRHDDPAAPDGQDRIIVAKTRLDEPAGENFDCDLSRWEDDFRPPLVRRLPALGAVELIEGWAGLYEMTPDHNPLIGAHPAIAGFYLANGFSGHGLMMAPAVGAAMAELLTTGASTRIDIAPFDPTRFARGETFHDDAMI
ncbi:MAG: FAD-binding oxidoreductase [Acidobacteria bacterium]|nr:FAD-binding oxidoreductase [Acidobacteriota bacterium]